MDAPGVPEGKTDRFKLFMVAIIIMMVVALIGMGLNMTNVKDRDSGFESMGINVDLNEDKNLTLSFEESGFYYVKIESEYLGNIKGVNKTFFISKGEAVNMTWSYDISKFYDNVMITITRTSTGYYEMHRLEDLV